MPPRAVLVRLMVCLLVATGLSTGPLLGAAERRPYGPGRDAMVAVARPLHRVAATVGLDQPGRLVDRATGDRSDPLRPEPPDAGNRSAPVAAAQPPPTLGPAVPPPARPDPDPPSPVPPLPSPPTGGPGGGSGNPPADPAVAGLPGPVLAAVPPRHRVVDPSSKLRLWAGGDSLGEYVGNQLLWPLANQDLTEVELDYRISTGLTRPDYFDWPGQVHEVMARDRPPDVLVFMIGGNDNQRMVNDEGVLGVGSDAWFGEYRARVTGIMDAAGNGTSHIYWIGLPPMRDPQRDRLARDINALVADEAGARPWISFVDIHTTFAGPDGGFATRVAGPDGIDEVVRAPDGVHITYDGSTWVADRIWGDVDRQWQLESM